MLRYCVAWTDESGKIGHEIQNYTEKTFVTGRISGLRAAGTTRRYFVEPLLFVEDVLITPDQAQEILHQYQTNFGMFQQQAYLNVHKSLKALLVQHQDLLELTQYFMELNTQFSFDNLPPGC